MEGIRAPVRPPHDVVAKNETKPGETFLNGFLSPLSPVFRLFFTGKSRHGFIGRLTSPGFFGNMMDRLGNGR